MRIIKLFISIALFFILQGCYLGHTLDTKYSVKIICNVDVLLNTCNNPKYINFSTTNEYRNKFLEGLEHSLSIDNLTVTTSDTADYTIVVNEIKATESTESNIVKDPDSEYNGQTYILHLCDVDAAITLYKGNLVKQLGVYYINADKDEKVKNNRTLGDLISGDNKENNTYRYKGLDDDVFLSLHYKCGDRSGGKVSQKLYKKLQKGKG